MTFILRSELLVKLIPTVAGHIDDPEQKLNG